MKVQEYLEVANNFVNKRKFEYFKQVVFPHTLRWEGGGKLHNIAGDSGGWTIWGIAYNYNAKTFKDLADFKDTTYDEAAAVAFIKYYLAVRADIVRDDLKIIYFDTAYNMGVSRAAKIMQKCCNVTVDGRIGPMTISRMKEVTEECLYEGRKGWYNLIVKNNQALSKFMKGWMNRLTDIYKQ